MEKETFAEKILEAETMLYHVAKTILHDDLQCEDAVQEGILKAYEKLDTLKEEAYFKTWLTRIVINQCYSQKRKERPILPLEEYQETISAPKEDYSLLYEALFLLKPKIRLTIVLHYVEGYSVKEISQILKVPTGTVKSRLAKGRKLLKAYINEGGGI